MLFQQRIFSFPGHSLAFFGSESTPQFLVCSMLRLETDALGRLNRTAMLTQDPFEVRSGRSSTVRLERLVYQSRMSDQRARVGRERPQRSRGSTRCGDNAEPDCQRWTQSGAHLSSRPQKPVGLLGTEGGGEGGRMIRQTSHCHHLNDSPSK